MAQMLIRERDFEEKVLKSELPVLVDFWAPWCAPCQALNSVLEELEKTYEGRIRVAKVNVEENPQLPALLGVRSLPSIFFFSKGAVVANLVGLINLDKVKKLVESWI